MPRLILAQLTRFFNEKKKRRQQSLFAALSLFGGAIVIGGIDYIVRRQKIKAQMTVSNTAQQNPSSYVEQFSPAPVFIRNAMLFDRHIGASLDEIFGEDLRTTSWWRSPKLNRDVGGSADSEHLDALGRDYIYGSGSPADNKVFYDWLSTNRNKYPRLTEVVYEKDHVHVFLNPFHRNQLSQFSIST